MYPITGAEISIFHTKCQTRPAQKYVDLLQRFLCFGSSLLQSFWVHLFFQILHVIYYRDRIGRSSLWFSEQEHAFDFSIPRMLNLNNSIKRNK